MHTRDSLETILSHLEAKVTNVIANEKISAHPEYLLDFLVVWKKRPRSLMRMAYQWCSAISEVAGRLGHSGAPTHQLGALSVRQVDGEYLIRARQHFRQNQNLYMQQTAQDPIPPILEMEFSKVGPSFDQIHSGGSSHYIQEHPPSSWTLDLLNMTLEIAFRLAVPNDGKPELCLSPIPHCDWVFETAFSSDNDEVIADAVCVWIADPHLVHVPTSSCIHYLAKCVERKMSFSTRLRQLSICH